MDAKASEKRRQGVEDSVDLSQDMTRVAKRAGRINTAPRNVSQDAFGRRVVGPTSAQIQAGTASPQFYANRERQKNIDLAKSSGNFNQTRFDFNRQNAGKQEMDDAGNIRAIAKPAPEMEAGVGGGIRVKQPPKKPVEPTGGQTPPTPLTTTAPTSGNANSSGKPAAPAPTAPTPPTKVAGQSLINGKPAKQFFQEAANRQRRSNSYGSVTPEAKPAVAPSPTPTNKATTAQSNTDAVARNARDVENKYPGLFGKLKNTNSTRPPLTSASNAVAGNPDRQANRGVFDNRSNYDGGKMAANAISPRPRAPLTAAQNKASATPAPASPPVTVSTGTDQPSTPPSASAPRPQSPRPPSPETLAAMKNEADLAAANRAPATTKLAKGAKVATKELGAAVNQGLPNAVSSITAKAEQASGKLAAKVNEVTAPARKFVYGDSTPSKAETEYSAAAKAAERTKRGPSVFDVPLSAGEERARKAKLTNRMEGGCVNPSKSRMKGYMRGGDVNPFQQSYDSSVYGQVARNKQMEDARKKATLTHRQAGGSWGSSSSAAGGSSWGASGSSAAPAGGSSWGGKSVAHQRDGGEMPDNEVIMVGEGGPEMLFKRKDGSMFVTPADVTAQIVEGIEMDNSPEGKAAMAAAKKRMKSKVRPKMAGGPFRSKPLGGVTLGGPLKTNPAGNIEPGQFDAKGQMDSSARLMKDGVATSPMDAQNYQRRLHGANTETYMQANAARAEQGLPLLPMPSNPFQRPGQY